MATDEKKEPARRRRPAAAPTDDAAKKPVRAPRARKQPKAQMAGEIEAAADGPAIDVAVDADDTQGATAPVESVGGEVTVGAPTASADTGGATGGGVVNGADAAFTAAKPEATLSHDEVRGVLGELLRLSGLSAGLEFKDAEDGAISVAVQFDPIPAGIQAGRRTPLMDSLQFLTNKLVNRPGSTGRRWVVLGAMGHPAPRPAPGTRQAKGQPPVQAAPVVASQASASIQAATPAQQPQGARPQREVPQGRMDERSLSVAPDAELAEASRRLSESAAKLGRYYVLFPMGEEDRARVVQAAAGTPGVRVSCEGEGRHRRVVFKPDAPSPLPKQTLPDYDDEDEDDGDVA